MKIDINLKRITIIAVLLLIGGDISLLFAAQSDAQSTTTTTTTTSAPSTPTPVLPRPVLGATAPTTAATTIPQANLAALASPASSPLAQPQQPTTPVQSQPAAAPFPLPVAAPMPMAEPMQDPNEAAFNAMAKNALPMSPEQIQRLRQMFSASQLAATASPGTPPRPVATSQLVRLDPGATPPVIRLGQGFVSSLVFVDSTGAPWPIEAYDVGNPGAFNIQWDKKTNVLMIQSTSLYTYGNLAVRLKGLVTPVMLTLVPGQKAIDYRVDLRVPGNGPNAIAGPSGDGLPNGANPDLLGILDGIPPAGSKTLIVSGGAAQAWVLNETLFIRTRLTILSPGWLSTMSSADGTKAYSMQKTSKLLVSDNGKPITLTIEGL
jgi:intracellular multiplication protein IcmK